MESGGMDCLKYGFVLWPGPPPLPALSLLGLISFPSVAPSLLFTDTKQYPVFVGHKPGRNTTQRHRLDIQMIMIMNRTLYIAAR